MACVSVDAADRMVVCHAFEPVIQVGVALNPTELRRVEKRGGDGPPIRATVEPQTNLLNLTHITTPSLQTDFAGGGEGRLPFRQLVVGL